MQYLVNNLNAVVNNSENIHILESESEFDSPGKHNGDDIIFNATVQQNVRYNVCQSVDTLSLHLTKVSLEFGAKQNPMSPSFYKIKSFEVIPVSSTSRNILHLGFEPSTNNLNDDQDYYFPLSDNLFFSNGTKTPIAGNESLRIDIEKGNSKQWNVFTTDYLPLTDFISVYVSGKLKFSFIRFCR